MHHCRWGRIYFTGLILCAIALTSSKQALASFLKAGDIVVSNASINGALYRIDPVTGDRSQLSGSSRGSGPDLFGPLPLAQALDGSIYTMDLVGMRIIRVDPQTGNRTVISSQETGLFDFESVGNGPDFVPPVVDLLPPPRTQTC